MKKRIEWSVYCLMVTFIIMGIFIAIGTYLFKQQAPTPTFWLLGVVWALLLVSGAYYAPNAVSVNDKTLCVHRSLRNKHIPLSEIAAVKLCPPTMGAIRICGSGGFFGYWGWFSERDLGKYFAYYGKSSDCFLVTLKNGKKYMLGCTDAPEMVQFITSTSTSTLRA